jgi:hypothetical protein
VQVVLGDRGLAQPLAHLVDGALQVAELVAPFAADFLRVVTLGDAGGAARQHVQRLHQAAAIDEGEPGAADDGGGGGAEHEQGQQSAAHAEGALAEQRQEDGAKCQSQDQRNGGAEGCILDLEAEQGVENA